MVALLEPFQRTTEFAAKPLPFTVNVNAEPPAVTVEGLMLIVIGPPDELIVIV